MSLILRGVTTQDLKHGTESSQAVSGGPHHALNLFPPTLWRHCRNLPHPASVALTATEVVVLNAQISLLRQ